MTATLDRRALSAAIADAHETGDPAQLARAYANASESLDAAGDRDAAAFLQTHALVYALEAGLDREAAALRAALARDGRDQAPVAPPRTALRRNAPRRDAP